MNGCGSGSHKCKAPYWEIVWLLSAFVWPAPSLSPTKTQFPMPLLCTINDDSGHQSLGCAAYQTPHKSLTMHSVEEGINLCTMMWTAPYIQHISEYMSKFRPILLNGIWLYDTQNTFYLIVRGLKNAFLVPLTPLLYRYLTVLWQSSSCSKEKLGILLVGWGGEGEGGGHKKWLFIKQINYVTNTIYLTLTSQSSL